MGSPGRALVAARPRPHRPRFLSHLRAGGASGPIPTLLVPSLHAESGCQATVALKQPAQSLVRDDVAVAGRLVSVDQLVGEPLVRSFAVVEPTDRLAAASGPPTLRRQGRPGMNGESARR